MKTHTRINPTETVQSFKLVIDVHTKRFYVGRQLDGATAQPVQKLTFDGLLRSVTKQRSLAREVVS